MTGRNAGLLQSDRVELSPSTAIHEAGHALAAYRLRRGIDYITIRPDSDDDDAAGYCRLTRLMLGPRQSPKSLGLTSEDDRAYGRWALRTRPRRLRMIETSAIIALAGPAADLRFEPSIGSELVGWRHDLDTARLWAELFCLERAGDPLALFRAWRQRASELVARDRNWLGILRLALALWRRGTLSGRRVRAILAAA